MKLRLLLVAFALPACVLAGEGADAKRTVAQESLALLRQAFPYRPAAGADEGKTPEVAGDTETLAPFHVVESRRSHELVEKIEGTFQKKKDERFSLIKGGTIYENSRLKLGAWGGGAGITFLKITW